MSVRTFQLPFFIAVAVLGLFLGGCSSKEQARPSQGAASIQANLERDLSAYRQLVALKSDEIAVTMGHEIVRKYPNTPAAAEVWKTLPEIQHRVRTKSERARRAVWTYFVGEEANAWQHKASIPARNRIVGAKEPVKLVLRRHENLGEGVYLSTGGKGFRCGDPCQLTMRIDDRLARTVQARLPKTAEPLIFLAEGSVVLKNIKDATRIEFDGDMVEFGPQTLAFDVEGFDPERFPPLEY